MFEEIRSNLDELERTYIKVKRGSLTTEEEILLEYFDSMMEELWDSDKIAKIILVHEDMFGDAKVNIQ